MATQALIGIPNKDGTITAIGCYSDGYLAGGVGETLVVHYTDEAKIRKLIELGALGRLGTEPVANPLFGETPGYTEDMAEWDRLYREINPIDTCNAYITRGYEYTAYTDSLENLITLMHENFVDYFYVFRDGNWYFIGPREEDKDFRSVAHALDNPWEEEEREDE